MMKFFYDNDESGTLTLGLGLLSLVSVGTVMAINNRNLDNQQMRIERSIVQMELESANLSALSLLRAEIAATKHKRSEPTIPTEGKQIHVPSTVRIKPTYQSKRIRNKGEKPQFNQSVLIKYIGNDEMLDLGILEVVAISRFKDKRVKTKARIPIAFEERKPIRPPRPPRPELLILTPFGFQDVFVSACGSNTGCWSSWTYLNKWPRPKTRIVELRVNGVRLPGFPRYIDSIPALTKLIKDYDKKKTYRITVIR